MKDKVIGILGGMGPAATADLFSQIIENTDAKDEQDHIRILIDNNPKMPNRQDAILYNTESPVPVMVSMAEGMKRSGADFIIIGANTAHYFYDEVASQVDIPFLHIIDESVKYMLELHPHVKKVGILGSNAALKSGLYKKSCDKFNLETAHIDESIQNNLHDAIFDFKYNACKESLIDATNKAIEYYRDNGSQAIILGCTELPIILDSLDTDLHIINPNNIIGEVAVKYAKNLI